MFYEFHTGLLTYLKFTSDLPNKFTEGTDLSIALSLKYKCQERDSLDKWKNAFHFSFKAFVLLIVSVLRPIEIRVFIKFFCFFKKSKIFFFFFKINILNACDVILRILKLNSFKRR